MARIAPKHFGRSDLFSSRSDLTEKSQPLIPNPTMRVILEDHPSKLPPETLPNLPARMTPSESFRKMTRVPEADRLTLSEPFRSTAECPFRSLRRNPFRAIFQSLPRVPEAISPKALRNAFGTCH